MIAFTVAIDNQTLSPLPKRPTLFKLSFQSPPRNLTSPLSPRHEYKYSKPFLTCSNTVSSYLSKSIDATKAKEVLDTCDLTNKDSFSPNVNKVINEVYPTSKKLTSTEHIATVSDVDTKTSTVVINTPKKKSKSKRDKL